MRKLFALILIALLLGAGIVALIETEPGYLLVAYGNYTIETSLWVGVLLLVLLTVMLYASVSLVRKLIGGQHSLTGWLGSRRGRLAARLTNRGLIRFSEGSWIRARRDLLRGARFSETPLVNYLLAARASHQLGEYDKVQTCLGTAVEAEPAAGAAVALARAELKLEAGQFAEAQQILQGADANGGRYPRALELMYRACLGLDDWAGLAGLMPELKKSRALPPEQCAQLEAQVYRRLLADSDREQGGNAADHLREAWKKLPAEFKQDGAMIGLYTEKLVAREAYAEAEKVILRALKQRWDSNLVRLYGYVISDNIARQLTQAESWLGEHTGDAQLLLCLGRLSARDKLWGKARDYFETSYRLEPAAETCAELGRLLSALGEANVAAAYFREGLMLQQAQLPSLPLPDKTVAHEHLLAR